MLFRSSTKSSSSSSVNGVLAAASFGILSNNKDDGVKYDTMSAAPVGYNLFYEESSGFSFFKNNIRDFNWALQAFLQCIAEAAAQQKDKTIAIPHVIRQIKKSPNDDYGANNNGNTNNIANYLNGGEWTIGGLSICYPSQHSAGGNDTFSQRGAMNYSALEWTRACRYLLTDLK